MVILRKRYLKKQWDNLVNHMPELASIEVVFNDYDKYDIDLAAVLYCRGEGSVTIGIALRLANYYYFSLDWFLKIIKCYLKEYGLKVNNSNFVSCVMLHEVRHLMQVTTEEYTMEQIQDGYKRHEDETFCCDLCRAMDYRMLPYEADADLYALTTLSRICNEN